MRSALWISSLLLVGCSASPATEDGTRSEPEESRPPWSIARELWRNGNREEALAYYDESLRDTTESPSGRLFHERGHLLFELGRYEDAIVDLERAIEINPYDGVACNELGRCHFALGNLFEARVAFTRAIGSSPNAAYNRGLVNEISGDPETALLDYTYAVEDDSENAEAHHAVGRMEARLGNRERALAAFTRAIDLGLADPDLLCDRSDARRDDDHRGKIMDLEAALEIDPRCGRALQRLDSLVPGQSYLQKAIDAYSSKIAEEPEDHLYLDRGLCLLAAGDLLGARADLTRLIDSGQASAEAYANRAMTWHEDEDAREKDARLALELDPNFTLAHEVLGYCAMGSGDVSAAVDHYRAAVATDLEQPRLRLGLANALLQANRIDECESQLSHAARLGGRTGYWHYLRGLLLDGSGDHDAAIEHLTHTVDDDPNYALAYWYRGRALRTIGRIDDAIEDFGRYIELLPDDPFGYQSRAESRMYNGDHRGAIDDYDALLRIDPSRGDDGRLYERRAEAHEALGDLEAAVADYSSAISRREGKYDLCNPLFGRGAVHRRLGNLQESVMDLTQSLQLFDSRADVYYERARTLSLLGFWDDAVSDLRTAAATFEFDRFESEHKPLYRAIAAAHRGDHEEALGAFDEAARTDPENDALLCLRGITKVELGDRTGAIADFTIAITLNPNAAEAYRRRGTILHGLGEHAGATADLQRADDIRAAIEDR